MPPAYGNIPHSVLSGIQSLSFIQNELMEYINVGEDGVLPESCLTSNSWNESHPCHGESLSGQMMNAYHAGNYPDMETLQEDMDKFKIEPELDQLPHIPNAHLKDSSMLSSKMTFDGKQDLNTAMHPMETSRGCQPNYTIHMNDNCVLQIGNHAMTTIKGAGCTKTSKGQDSRHDETVLDSESSSRCTNPYAQVRPATSQSINTSNPPHTQSSHHDTHFRNPEENSFQSQSDISGRRNLTTSPDYYEQMALPGNKPTTSQWQDDQEPPNNLYIDVDEDMFHGRENEMRRLHDLLHRKRKVGVCGMGGAGKTTFVNLYAIRNFNRYTDGIFIVDASMPSILPVEFAKLAGPEYLNLIREPTENIEMSMSLIMNWLMKHKNFLLIYDAADQQETLNMLGRQQPTGHRYIPPRLRLKGHVIITSQCPKEKFQSVQIMEPLVLSDLDDHSASTFLSKRVYYDDDVNEIEESSLHQLISGYLPGCLPLFLEQTAAYIRGQNTTFLDYLEDLKSKRMPRNPIDEPNFGDNSKSVDVTFDGNFNSLQQSNPIEFSILKISALCHSKDIPLSLYTIGSLALLKGDIRVNEEFGDLQERLLTEVGDNISDTTLKAAEKGIRLARNCLNVSKGFQLVKFNRGSSIFSVHEVIQQQLRLFMEGRKEIHGMMEVLARILIFILMSDDLPLEMKKDFLSHSEACCQNMETFGFCNKSFKQLYLDLRLKTGHVLLTLGFITSAQDIISDVEQKVPYEGAETIKMGLLGLKASVALALNDCAAATRFIKKGTEMSELCLDIDPKAIENVYETTLIKLIKAKIMLYQHDVLGEEIGDILREVGEAYLIVEKRTSLNCAQKIFELLILNGEWHYKKGEQFRLQRKLSESNSEFQIANSFFSDFTKTAHPDTVLYDIVKVNLMEARMKLRGKIVPRDCLCQALEELNLITVSLKSKLNREHRHVAWILEKVANILVDLGNVDDGLSTIHEAQEILDQVFGKDEGFLQKGQLSYAKGRALYIKKDFLQSKLCMETTKEQLQHVRLHPIFKMASCYLVIINRQQER